MAPHRFMVLAGVIASVAACSGARPRAGETAAPASGAASSPSPSPSPSPDAGAGAATPCIPGPPLVATEIYRRLEPYAWSLYGTEEPPPPTKLGSCTVERNVIRAADGAVVAELGCGVRVLQRGILDDLGLQIGARGQDVLDRKPRPTPELSCMPNGPDQARCMFERAPGADLDSTWYVVAGHLDETITGDAAVAFFAPRTLVELAVSVWCH